MTPQCTKVVAHIERWGSINSIEAIRHYGITRLAARIHDLHETNRAMKSVEDPNAAKGFVKYVPDFDRRRKLLKRRMHQELFAARDDQLSLINSQYAAKFAVLDIKEREHV